MEEITSNIATEETTTPEEIVEEIEEGIAAADVMGEPESELEDAVEDELPVAPDEDVLDKSVTEFEHVLELGDGLPNLVVGASGNGRPHGQIVDIDELAAPDSEEVEDESSLSLVDMVNMIDDISNSLEIQRQMFDAREQLTQVCLALGIKKDDQEFLHTKFQKSYIKEELTKIMADKDLLDKKFFTREDGTIINVTTLQKQGDQYEAKKELVEYLYSFYDMERSIQNDLDEMRSDIRKFKKEDISSASATVANNLKQGIDERWAEMEAMEDGAEKEARRTLLTRLQSSYTFADLLDVLDRHPSVAANAMKDMVTPTRVKAVGKQYADKLKQGNTFSKLYGVIQDDIDKSIEKQFLHEDDYLAGKENFFGFFLIRFFGMESWTDESAHIREMHNATCIVLNNLMNGTLDKEFRDEVVDNIKKVWAKVKEV